ncbi:MAG TPA: Gfo/Idh/MocA family oxidoreductase [Bryobacteraceae bacterium]|jgi:predicted dehydrogenase
MFDDQLDRRDFFKRTSGITAGVALAGKTVQAAQASDAPAKAAGRVIGANDRIQIGLIGCGSRATFDAAAFTKYGQDHNACQLVAVADVYEKRKRRLAEKYNVKGFLDYREVIAMKEVDAVVIAIPDHWHAQAALDAMHAGKDVYVEKPMCHTNEEVRQMVNTVRETGRVLQVGSQTTSADQWWKAKKAIADGMIGKMIMSQGSYHRNSIEGEWNWPMDAGAGPDAKGEDYIDWKMWLGSAPQRPFDADRYFRFRKYWDYSGGIATDLFFHVVAPMNICWPRPQYPTKVMASGGIYAFHDSREVPDTFHLLAEYAEGHSLVLSSTLGNSQHIPGLIRGHEGTLIMVEDGKFERYTENLIVRPDLARRKPFPDYKFGTEEIKIPVDRADMMALHIGNFLDCVRSRQKPHLDVETAAHAQILINLAVESYRSGRVRYWDEANWRSSDTPVQS